MECVKLNEYIISQLEDKKITLTSLAKKLKIKPNDLVDALSNNNMSVDLYNEIVNELNVDLDKVVFYKKSTKNARFVSKYEKAIMNGSDAIDSLKSQESKVIEADSYGYYLIEYAINLDDKNAFEYIINKKLFGLSNDSYLKKNSNNFIKQREVSLYALYYILKNNLKEYYYLIEKFANLNKGMFKDLDEEYRYLFLKFIDTNRLTDILDLLLKPKKMSFLKSSDDNLTYSELCSYSLEYKLPFICGYLGSKMTDFNSFVNFSLRYQFEEGVYEFFASSNEKNFAKTRNYKQELQKIFIEYCLQGAINIVSIMLSKKLYNDINVGFEKALISNNKELIMLFVNSYYNDLDKDLCLINSCKQDNELIAKLFVNDATTNAKNMSLKAVKNNTSLMASLFENGAKFDNSVDGYKQMNKLITYLIKTRK